MLILKEGAWGLLCTGLWATFIFTSAILSVCELTNSSRVSLRDANGLVYMQPSQGVHVPFLSLFKLFFFIPW